MARTRGAIWQTMAACHREQVSAPDREAGRGYISAEASASSERMGRAGEWESNYWPGASKQGAGMMTFPHPMASCWCPKEEESGTQTPPWRPEV
jgi:hypothetical protein